MGETKKTSSSKEHNLRFFEQGKEVPAEAMKVIKAGRLKGMSDINPMWRIQRMTEIFGPVGFGWKYTIDKQWAEQHGQEVKVFCNVLLYIRDPETGEWSDAIPGNGGSAVVSIEKNGAYVNAEAYKTALTDALSIAMKPIGIGANVWLNKNANVTNESKYEQYTQAQPQQVQSMQPTEEQKAQAVMDIGKANSRAELLEVWNKWAAINVAFTQNSSVFYKSFVAKQNSLQS